MGLGDMCRDICFAFRVCHTSVGNSTSFSGICPNGLASSGGSGWSWKGHSQSCFTVSDVYPVTFSAVLSNWAGSSQRLLMLLR